MTALLALITVVSWGTWIPLAQAVPGVPQRSRTFYVTVGNISFCRRCSGRQRQPPLLRLA